MASVAALVGFFGIWLLLWLPLAITVTKRQKLSWTYPPAQEQKISLLLPLYGVAPLAVWCYSHFFTTYSWANYGLVWNQAQGATAGCGFVVGVTGVLLLVLGELGLGWRTFNSEDVRQFKLNQLGLGIFGLLALTGFIGGIEELVFRGVMVQGLLVQGPGWAVAVITSVIFALSHLIWDGPEGMLSLPGLSLMGAVLILARWVGGGLLGLPWGLHTGWIFAIALLDTFRLAPPVETASPWLAGKSDQPLTGLPALSLLILTGLGLWGYHQLF